MINFINPHSVVNFIDNRLDPIIVNKIINEGKAEGLSNTEALNKNLRDGEYIPVLKAIWSERDKTRRLEWLRSHAAEMHAPLMFEQSIAEFVNSPTIETVNQISIPLIQAAKFRVKQDSSCSTDPSVYNGDAAERMQMTYQTSLNKQIEKYLNRTYEAIVLENKMAISSAVKTKILATAQLSISQELPLPHWIGLHGMSIFISGEVEMHPENAFKAIRDKMANETIKRIGGH